MKSSISYFNLIVVIFVCLSVKQASTLQCYECQNFVDISSCKKLLPSMIRTCPESDAASKYVCRKFTFKSKDLKYTFERRSCGKLDFENIFEYDDANNQRRVLAVEVPVTSMICNTDLCNSAVDNPPKKLILFLSTLLSVSLYYKCVFNRL
ncbi:hypothetical protein PYW08_001240 [Mythimna loreyi]|uniref:Uncharacterized protein n=1 Tax=Mythimna loreyi TaxID=667449 RepID=A0ACC2R0Z3_9NEOP|nr:hypothetical protein PYW08_001240 [Mythimna loreyi]